MGTDAEEWRVIEEWPAYEVSNAGRVRSLTRKRGGEPIVMSPYSDFRGHYRVGLRAPGRKRNMPIHTVVLRAFVGPKPAPGYIATWHNDDLSDNRAENLGYISRSEAALGRIERNHHGNQA